MKKIISVLVSLTILFSAQPVFYSAADYEGHWAQSEIKELIENNILKGDSSGNIRPEAYITRAEFIALINRSLDFSQKAKENYPDVSEEKWYYNDFLIAKNYEYIKGDENGFANPDNNITRGETAVIISRIAGSHANNTLSFSDEIPLWAREAVESLAGSGIINGYEDNTFRASNPIKRAEAAVIILKTKKAKLPEKNNKNNDKGDISGMTAVSTVKKAGGGSSGGGGGGGSAPVNKNLASPIIKLIDNEYNLSWESVKNAKSYTVLISCDNVEKETDTTDTVISLKEELKELTSSALIDKINVNAAVRANARSGYNSSGFSNDITFEYVVFNPEESEDLGVKISCSGDAEEKYSLEFPEGIKSITLKKSGETKTYESPVSPLDITSFATKDGEISEEDYVFIAEDGKGTQIIVADLKYGGGDGSEENPYIIANKRHFENIPNNMSAHYKQIADINEAVNPLYSESRVFYGSYFSDDNKEINIKIEDGSEYASLFGKCENANISNITVNGSIEGSGMYTAGICGYAVNTSISGCINNVNINISGEGISKGAYCGGIVGYADADSQIENCINNGNIASQAGTTGGIAGESAADISYCINNGNISSDNTMLLSANIAYCGGIAGNATVSSDVSGCINNGIVKNDYSSVHDSNTSFSVYTGGIAGSGINIKDCVSSEDGKIISNVLSGSPSNLNGAENLGGIVGNLPAGGLVSGCVNSSSFEFPTALAIYWGGGIAGWSAGTIEKSLNKADLSSTGRQFGGIAGRTKGKISICKNSGNIASAGWAGGITARIDPPGIIEYSVNTGSISGRYAGGFSGSAGGADIKIKNSFSAPLSVSNNAIIAYNQKVSTENVYYVKAGSEAVGANTDVSEITAANLNSADIIAILNGGADEPVFEAGEVIPEITLLIGK